MSPAVTLDIGDRLMSFGFQVFALNPSGLPWGNCDRCKLDRSPEHMANCSCTNCHAFYRATDDLDVLARQLARQPGSILGVRTGLVSHLAVLDFDCHPGQPDGLEVHAQWDREDRLPRTPEIRTGGGGLHEYFQLAQACPTKTGFRPGVDLKADGGYVVAPGFAKRGKAPYVELAEYGRGLDDLSLAPIPEWILAEAVGSTAVGVLRKQREISPFEHGSRDPLAAFNRALAKLAEGKVGGRNTGVFVCGCKARLVADRGLAREAEMRLAVLAVALRVGLTEAQFNKQWLSGVAPLTVAARPTPLTRK